MKLNGMRKCYLLIFLICFAKNTATVKRNSSPETCEDRDYRCFDLVASGGEMSCSATSYTTKFCPKTCVLCGSMDKRFDVRLLPDDLKPLSFLIGIWRSEAGGKAIFPTIPIFTYGEEIEISLPQPNMKGLKALNYSAFAWDINNQQELHSEYGYIAMNSRTNEVALTTVMNNGFVTIEQGKLFGKSIKFLLHDVGRISFSRDLPVHGVIRTWRVIGTNTFEHRLSMETLTHRMQTHTSIVYTKIYP